MSYTLITANRNYSSWSLRPWVLMKALGHPVRGCVSSRSPGSTTTTTFRGFRPTGQVPLLIDGERTRVGFARDRALPRRPARGRVAGRTRRAGLRRMASSTEMHGGFGALRNAAR